MPKRPIPVIILSCVLAASGALGIAYHLKDFNTQHPLQFDVLGILLLRLLAIVAGIFMLRAANWARWLAMAWITFHLVISIWHPWSQLVIHGVVFAVFAFFLFRPAANAYFRGRRTEGA